MICAYFAEVTHYAKANQNIDRRSSNGFGVLDWCVMDSGWDTMPTQLPTLLCCNAVLFYAPNLHCT
jgi:hypothetical protein